MAACGLRRLYLRIDRCSLGSAFATQAWLYSPSARFLLCFVVYFNRGCPAQNGGHSPFVLTRFPASSLPLPRGFSCHQRNHCCINRRIAPSYIFCATEYAQLDAISIALAPWRSWDGFYALAKTVRAAAPNAEQAQPKQKLRAKRPRPTVLLACQLGGTAR